MNESQQIISISRRILLILQGLETFFVCLPEVFLKHYDFKHLPGTSEDFELIEEENSIWIVAVDDVSTTKIFLTLFLIFYKLCKFYYIYEKYCCRKINRCEVKIKKKNPISLLHFCRLSEGHA